MPILYNPVLIYPLNFREFYKCVIAYVVLDLGLVQSHRHILY
jgi:cellobiose-specific phosphotransferase system component IIC